MKKLYFKIFLLLLCYNQLTAQNNVGIGTSSPDASAKLDVNTAADGANAKKGFLTPQISLSSTADGTPFSSLSPVGPAPGLLVYNTNASITGTGANGVGFYFNSGTKGAPVWKKLSDGGVAWLLSGNASVGASNYIGTNDANDFVVRTNQTAGATPTTASERIRVTSAGDVVVNDGNNATIFRVEGDNDANLIKTVNGASAAADVVGIGVTGTPINKLDIEGKLRVGGGVIQNGTTAVSTTTDLGLYSLTSGSWIRIAANAAPIKFFTDQGGSTGSGTNATMAVDNANGGGVMIAAETGGTGNAGSPNSRAALEISSTTKGMLTPRLTTTQRDAMGTTLTEGLLIYNTTNDCFEFWDTKSTPSGGNGFWNSLCQWCKNVVVINSNQTGYNLNTALGGARAENYCVYINSGVTLQAAGNGGGSSTAGNPGFNASTMPSGSYVYLYNYGNILAGGGNGGQGADESDAVCNGDDPGGSGGTGGHAIVAGSNAPVVVFNYGLIRAGGGGGGGGAPGCCAAGGGGGGGAGTPAGTGGAGRFSQCTSGFVCTCGRNCTSTAGNAGAATTAGTGGAGCSTGSTGCPTCNGRNAATGGTGGTPGVAGSAGGYIGDAATQGAGGGAGLALKTNGSGSSITTMSGGTTTGSTGP